MYKLMKKMSVLRFHLNIHHSTTNSFPISDLAVIIVSAAAIAILLVCIIVVLICLRKFKWYVETSEQL